MSSPELEHSQPVTGDEVAAAERLAEALEGRQAPGVDLDALRAAHLLQVLAPRVATVASARARSELVASAARAHARARWQRPALAAAAVLAVTLLAAVLWRVPGSATERLLARRERAAGQAVAGVTTGWNLEAAQSARLGSAFDDHWRERLSEKLHNERAALIATSSSTSSTSDATGAGTT